MAAADLTAEALTAVAAAGAAAYGNGRPVTECPYPTGDIRADLWVRHYVAAQRAARGGYIDPPPAGEAR